MNLWSWIIDILFPISHIEQALVERYAAGNLPVAKESPMQNNLDTMLAYRDPLIRSSIRILKTRRSMVVAKIFAQVLHHHLQNNHGANAKTTWLVPIPITPSRLRERGFNQTELIIDELVKLDKNYHAAKHILKKTKETAKQAVSISKTARRENIKGSFSATFDQRILTNDLAVVIDDVVTTGATLGEAVRTLENVGYKNVMGLAVAH